MSARPHRHDLPWRIGGVMLMAAGYACGGIGNGASPAMSLVGFVLVIAGLTLVVQGRRMWVALRVERSRHRDLPLAIHSRRLTNRHARSRRTR